MTSNTLGNDRLLIGIISDTHGHLLPRVEQALAGVDAIIHAGDIGTAAILENLERIAPVFAVRGNMDGGGWSRNLPANDVVELGQVLVYVLHDLYALDIDPQGAGFQAVVSGHTHRPAAERKDGVLYVNPGSASYPKQNDTASVALLRIQGKQLDVDFVAIE